MRFAGRRRCVTARDYVGGEFQPKSVDEFVSLVKDGGKPSGHILQVYGYWDMVAAFVVHGALDESLIFDTCQEMYFQFEKIQPYLAGFRAKDEPAGVSQEHGGRGRGCSGKTHPRRHQG